MAVVVAMEAIHIIFLNGSRKGSPKSHSLNRFQSAIEIHYLNDTHSNVDTIRTGRETIIQVQVPAGGGRGGGCYWVESLTDAAAIGGKYNCKILHKCPLVQMLGIGSAENLKNIKISKIPLHTNL